MASFDPRQPLSPSETSPSETSPSETPSSEKPLSEMPTSEASAQRRGDFRQDPALRSPQYPALFQTFTASSDEKEVIARSVLAIARENAARTLLDLGAGDTQLTSRLAPEFSLVTAVEKKLAFCEKLQMIPNVHVQQTAMEEFVPEFPHDLVLLSYSLSGVSPEKVDAFIERLPTFATPEGKVLIVTYEKGCPWDLFADEVHKLLDFPRSAGTSTYMRIAREKGLILEDLSASPSHMWSDTLENLASLTSFFFASKEAEYWERIDEVVGILKKHTVTLPDGRIGLCAVQKVLCLRSSDE